MHTKIAEDLKLLNKRLDSLEKQNRRLKILFWLLGLAVPATFFIAPMKDRVVVAAGRDTGPIRAEKFEVVNRDGKVVAELGGDDRGGNLSVFNGQNSRDPIVAVYANPNGGGTVGIYEKMASSPRPARAADMGVTAGLEVYNAAENEVARVVAEKGGGGSLDIYNARGREGAQIATNEAGGFFSLINSSGVPQVGANCMTTGGAIAVLNTARQITAVLRSLREGGDVEVLYPNGTAAAIMHVQTTGGDIGVTNRSGISVAQLGVNPGGDADLFLNNHEGKRFGWLTTLANNQSGGFQLFEPATGKIVFQAP